MHEQVKRLFAALAVSLTLWATPAAAQFSATYVSSTGSDGNPCLPGAPCRTLQRAHNATIPGGVINVLDAADYGAISITKAITINGGGRASIVHTGNSSAILVTAFSSERVVIDGVLIVHSGIVEGFGIFVSNARDVLVRNSVVTGFRFGVATQPSSTSISVILEESSIVNSEVGVLVQGNSVQSTIRVFDSLIAGSTVAGVRASGPLARAEVSGSQILRTPMSLDQENGGTIYSYGNNVLSPGFDLPTPATLN